MDTVRTTQNAPLVLCRWLVLIFAVAALGCVTTAHAQQLESTHQDGSALETSLLKRKARSVHSGDLELNNGNVKPLESSSMLLHVITRALRRRKRSTMGSVRDAYNLFYYELNLVLGQYKNRLHANYKNGAMSHVDYILRIFPKDSVALSTGDYPTVKFWINRTLAMSNLLMNKGGKFLECSSKGWFNDQNNNYLLTVSNLEFTLFLAGQSYDSGKTFEETQTGLGGGNDSESVSLTQSVKNVLAQIRDLLLDASITGPC